MRWQQRGRGEPRGRGLGFTLLELLVAVVILGILAAIALPNFGRAAERAKVRDAQAILSALFEAERIYRLDQDTFGNLADLVANGYVSDPDSADSNADWNFATSNVAAAAFTATATRTGGSFNGSTVEIDQAFDRTTFGGDHPLRGS